MQFSLTFKHPLGGLSASQRGEDDTTLEKLLGYRADIQSTKKK